MKKRTQLGLAITSASLLLGAGSVNAAELEITITNATKASTLRRSSSLRTMQIW